MCRATMDDAGFRPRGGRRLEVRAFYLRISSSSSTAAPPKELSLVYRPALGGAALALGGRALPPASPAEVTLLRADAGAAAVYASADRVSATDGARFEVYAGKELAAEGVFNARPRGGWRVECRRAVASRAVMVVAEVVVLAEGGVLLRSKARASPRGVGCGTRLEGIPEEGMGSWGCECGTCGDEWEVVDDGDEWKKGHEEMAETETVKWALEMGAWAVCVGVGVGVGLLATARRLRRKRVFC